MPKTKKYQYCFVHRDMTIKSQIVYCATSVDEDGETVKIIARDEDASMLSIFCKLGYLGWKYAGEVDRIHAAIVEMDGGTYHVFEKRVE